MHSMSWGLRGSPPRQGTNTCSHPRAASACGACFELLFEPPRVFWAVLVAADPAELAPAVVAPNATSGGGRPTALPLTLMLLASNTAVAAMVRLPATMPASFAFTTPWGANRSTSPPFVLSAPTSV